MTPGNVSTGSSMIGQRQSFSEGSIISAMSVDLTGKARGRCWSSCYVIASFVNVRGYGGYRMSGWGEVGRKEQIRLIVPLTIRLTTVNSEYEMRDAKVLLKDASVLQ